MKVRAKMAWLVGALLTLAGMLIPAGSAFAQQDGRAAAAAMGGIFLFVLIFCGVLYVYFALAIQTIAQKTNTENPWLAWIPIVNIILLLNIAKKPIWWFILFLIPLVGLIMAIIVWMGVAEARNKPNWWGILMIVPGVNLIVPGYLAWVD
jgi:hypothetical protein